ncbi:MAG: hypothetical protein R3B07_04640 [Polyangiaceae bacterium]
MNFIDDRAHAGRQRQQQGLIEEALKSNARIVEAVDISPEGRGLVGTTGSTLKNLFGGKLRIDALQVLRFDSGGWHHCFLQPFSGMSSMPGEHYGVLNGCLAAPAILRPGGVLSGPRWESGYFPEVSQHLNGHAGLKTAVKAIKFQWQTGLGEIDLSWGLQLRSRGDGTTEVVMQAGRYGGFTTPHVGFAVWQQVVRRLSECLYPAACERQYYIDTPRFIEVFSPDYHAGYAATTSAVPGAAGSAPAAAAQLDYLQCVRASLTGHLGKRVWIDGIPAAQHSNLYQHVLPPELGQMPLLGAVDLTTFGSAKDAVVVTPTHLVSKEFEERQAVYLSAIRRELEDTFSGIVVEVAERGAVKIPYGVEPEAVRALVRGIIQLNTWHATHQ